MRFILLLALFMGVSGCVSTSHVPTEIANEIPRTATAIRIDSNQPAAEFYRTIYRNLAAKGYTIAQENEEMGTLSTGPKDIGQETTLAIAVFVQDEASGSSAILRGTWGITATMAAGFSAGMGMSVAGGTGDRANWRETGRPRAAFGQMAILAHDIPNTGIQYLTD